MKYDVARIVNPVKLSQFFHVYIAPAHECKMNIVPFLHTHLAGYWQQNRCAFQARGCKKHILIQNRAASGIADGTKRYRQVEEPDGAIVSLFGQVLARGRHRRRSRVLEGRYASSKARCCLGKIVVRAVYPVARPETGRDIMYEEVEEESYGDGGDDPLDQPPTGRGPRWMPAGRAVAVPGGLAVVALLAHPIVVGEKA